MPGPPAPGTSQGPGGLTVIMHADPERAARALAATRGISITAGGNDTTQAVGRLLDAIRPDPEAPVAPLPTVARPTPRPNEVELERLAAGMRRAEDMADRTRRRVADDLSRNLTSSLVIHPDTLRDAAAELTVAMAASAEARSGRAPTSRRARAARIGSVGAAGATATAVGLMVAWPAGLAVAGVGAAGALARRRTGRRNARVALPQLEASEELARRRWERLAGVGTDPVDIDAIARRHDPQAGLVGDLLSHHPAVRAAQRVADERRRAWVEGWQLAVGDPLIAASSPEPDQAVALVTTTPDGSSVVPSLEADAPAVLVVVSPYDGLDEAEGHALHLRLLALPDDVEVIVVLSTDVLDGVDDLSVSSPDDTSERSLDDEQHHERIIDLTRRSTPALPEPTSPAPDEAGGATDPDDRVQPANAHAG